MNYNYGPYYRGYQINNRNDIEQFSTEEIITLNQAIELIKKSVQEEQEDIIFYNDILKKAPTEKEKKIIEGIINDEQNHNQILRKIYFDFTNQLIPQQTSPNQKMNDTNYQDELERAFFGEIDAIKKYRKILATMPSGMSYKLLMSILTDEITHAIKYNYLLQNRNK